MHLPDRSLRHLPALPFAAGALVGAPLASHLTFLPVPLLAGLLAATLAQRRAVGTCLAGLAAGLLAATVALDLPRTAWPAMDASRPVEVHGRIAGHWRRTDWGWRTTLRLDRLVQGRRVDPAHRDLLFEIPGPDPPAPAGATIAARGYLRRSAGYANRLPVPPGPWRLTVKSPRLVEAVAPPGPLARLATALRRRVEAACDRAESPGTALVRALVLGDPGRLPPAWLRGLRRSGLSHLLAVSGLHVGLIGGVALLAATPLGRRGRIVAALAAVAVYLLVAGPRPALLRSSLMAVAAGAALLAGRAPAAGNALALAAAGLVLASPELAVDLGFGLTVAATAGIVLLAPVFVGAWSGAEAADPATAGPGRPAALARRWLVRALAASVAAQLAATPLAVPAFHLVTPAAPLLNLVAVPWTAAALVAACGWALLAALVPAAGAATAPVLDLAAAPYGWPVVGPPWAWGCLPVAASAAACALAVAALAVLLARPRRAGAWGLALGLAVAAGGWQAATGDGRPAGGGGPGPAVELAMLDVGQGDSILLRDGRRRVLVDGGGWRRGDFGGRVLLPALLAEGVGRLDVAVLSHPDADHCGGLVDLASYVAIGEVWATAEALAAPCGRDLAALPAVTVRRLGAGDRRRVGRWSFEVLHPDPNQGPRTAGDDNDRSLVLAAEALGRRVLLTGDVEAPAERMIAVRLRRLGAPLGGDPHFDVLKVAHHGSRTSTTASLLAAVRPRLALVSAGPGNPYGHPAAPVLARLAKTGARVLRTDRQGEVVLRWTVGGPLAIELPGEPR